MHDCNFTLIIIFGLEYKAKHLRCAVFKLDSPIAKDVQTKYTNVDVGLINVKIMN